MKSLNFKNYQPDALEQYWSVRNNTKDVRLDYFLNKISYDSQTKMITIDVDATKEYENTPGLINNNLSNQKIHTHAEQTEKINSASGTQIQLPLGDGLLEFCYADFTKKKQLLALPFLLSAYDFSSETESLSGINTAIKPEKNIENVSQYRDEVFTLYEKIFITAKDFFTQSCYTNIFPPVFLRPTNAALQHYLNYINTIQKEFMELLEFCFDVDFYQDDFSQLTCIDRYHLYREITGTPDCHMIEQFTSISPLSYMDAQFPYGFPISEFKKRLSHPDIRSERTTFEKDYHLDAGTLDRHYLLPSILKTYFSISTIHDMLQFEFTKLLEQGTRPKKCKNCGRYFILKGNYAAEYCSRISPDTSLTCQQTVSYQNYNDKIKSVPAWSAYNKYYKRYFARFKVGTIKETVFKKWQYQAVNKRDACIDGTLTLDDYVRWLDESFPNRKGK